MEFQDKAQNGLEFSISKKAFWYTLDRIESSVQNLCLLEHHVYYVKIKSILFVLLSMHFLPFQEFLWFY